jgi:hypothetical protein
VRAREYEHPIPRSLNIMSTSTTTSRTLDRRWKLSDRTACESRVKSKKKKNEPLGRYDTINVKKRQRREKLQASRLR